MKPIYRLAAVMLLIVLLTSACAPVHPARNKSLLEITSMISSLGGEGENNETGIYSYTAILTNYSGLPINVKTITPEVQAAFAARLLEDSTGITVEKAIPTGESIEVNGKLRFDFKDLTKQQIMGMGEPVAGFDVISQSYLPLPPAE
jgi:hypothetical protein